MKKVVDDALDDDVDNVSGKKDNVDHNVDGGKDIERTMHTRDAIADDDSKEAAKKGLDVKPHAKKVTRRRSISDVPEVTARGNTAYEEDARLEVDEKKFTLAAKGNDV